MRIESMADDIKRRSNTVNHLKTKHQDIERKLQLLKTVRDSKADQLRTELDAEMTLKTTLRELSIRFKT